MKEKIERFSKGDFEYELPFICLSEEEIRITLEAEKKSNGSFVISNTDSREMKGVIYSSNRLVRLMNPTFQGTEATVSYEIDTVFLNEGDRIEGEFCIVCEFGERLLPFSILVEDPFCMTSLGKMKDLFQFANLARVDWSEAKKVFRSEDFERIFLSNDVRYRFIYRNLIKSISTSQALEEFLIAIHKKAAIRLEIDKKQVDYQVQTERIVDKLILTKNNWGYAEIRVSTDAPFLQLEQKFLWADRFIGNSHQISYSIDPSHLKHGNNYGHLYIKTAYQTITVDISCSYIRSENKAAAPSYERRITQETKYHMTRNYLNFRLNRIELADYLKEAELLVKKLPGPETSKLKELMKIHHAILSGKSKLAEELLADLALEELALKKRSVFEYCIYLYLCALYYKDDSSIKHASDTIRIYYENGYSDWRFLWLLLNTDKRYEKNKSVKLLDMKEQFLRGCKSPILYYEAIGILNEEPYLLRELGSFEIQVLNFGIRNWILSREVANQFIYLTNKKKSFDRLVYQGLVKLYDEYETTEILTAICCLLIKGMKKDEEYFKWYQLGVDAQLRITELYEYYMYAISNRVEGPLAQPVLLYFIYNSNLNDKKKAFLYANVIKNKDKNETIYRTYYKRMEVFATKMLEGHYISYDLAVLYQEFFNRTLVSGDIAKHLPYVLYRNELVCKMPNMTSVLVIHKELGIEETVQLTEGKTQIDLYSGSAELVLVDSFGNRFVESVEYAVTPYMNAEEYESACLEHSRHPMLLIHLFDRYQKYRIMNEASMALRRMVLSIEGLTKEYLTLCYQTLIDYHYEKYDDEQLEHYLKQIDLYQVKPAERVKLMELMVIRLMHQKALRELELYGMEKIPVKRLVKLCSGWMVRPEAEYQNDFIVSLCDYVFKSKKYDEAVLRYLVKFYKGSTREMFQLWKAAKEFDLDTQLLEERLLVQMLFSESYVEDSFLVFQSYYKDVINETLVRAFLSYYAYRFLVHDTMIAAELFPIMKRELHYEENDVCLLAWLKYNTSNHQLTQAEQIFAEYNIGRFVRKGLVFPFFLDYRSQLSLPDRILDKCYITYHANPGNQVYLHYRLLNHSEEFITERMPNCFQGIHIKEFMLFYREVIQYYITEESAEDTNVTESYHLQYDCGNPEDDESKYNQINLMLLAMEMKDEHTLLEMMEGYAVKEHMIAACFQPIE